jgi:hypothetical protein
VCICHAASVESRRGTHPLAVHSPCVYLPCSVSRVQARHTPTCCAQSLCVFAMLRQYSPGVTPTCCAQSLCVFAMLRQYSPGVTPTCCAESLCAFAMLRQSSREKGLPLEYLSKTNSIQFCYCIGKFRVRQTKRK